MRSGIALALIYALLLAAPWWGVWASYRAERRALLLDECHIAGLGRPACEPIVRALVRMDASWWERRPARSVPRAVHTSRR